jgi:hypothetical protein
MARLTATDKWNAAVAALESAHCELTRQEIHRVLVVSEMQKQLKKTVVDKRGRRKSISVEVAAENAGERLGLSGRAVRDMWMAVRRSHPVLDVMSVPRAPRASCCAGHARRSLHRNFVNHS